MLFVTSLKRAKKYKSELDQKYDNVTLKMADRKKFQIIGKIM